MFVVPLSIFQHYMQYIEKVVQAKVVNLRDPNNLYCIHSRCKNSTHYIRHQKLRDSPNTHNCHYSDIY